VADAVIQAFLEKHTSHPGLPGKAHLSGETLFSYAPVKAHLSYNSLFFKVLIKAYLLLQVSWKSTPSVLEKHTLCPGKAHL